MHARDDQHYPGPRVRDWLVLAIAVAFVACGVVVLPMRPDVAVPCLAFFGVCAAVAILTIVRKRRFATLRPLTVEIVGGTPIRPSRTQVAGLGVTLLGLGVLLLAYWHSGPIVLILCLGILIAAGALLLLGVLTGHLPAGFLQFDPAGLTREFCAHGDDSGLEGVR